MAEAAEMDETDCDSKDIRAEVALVYEEHVGKIAHVSLTPSFRVGTVLIARKTEVRRR
jgi:hypothetical protein